MQALHDGLMELPPNAWESESRHQKRIDRLFIEPMPLMSFLQMHNTSRKRLSSLPRLGYLLEGLG